MEALCSSGSHFQKQNPHRPHDRSPFTRILTSYNCSSESIRFCPLQISVLKAGQVHPRTPVDTSALLSRGLPELDIDANEVLLFHGTKHDLAPTIVSHGFDERVAGDGLFGAGIYFAESVTKSDKYCTPGPRSVCSMFLARVALGTPCEQLKGLDAKERRAPARPGGGDRRFDSVLGVTTASHPGALLRRFREFVVYDRRQCYPELLVEFRRI